MFAIAQLERAEMILRLMTVSAFLLVGLYSLPKESHSVAHGQQTVETSFENLRSPNQEVRDAAVNKLIEDASEHGLGRILPGLLSALKEPDADVRLRAAGILAAAAYLNEVNARALSQAGPDLTGALGDRDPRVREASAHAIALMMPKPPEAAAPALMELLKDSEPTARKAALEGLGRMTPTPTILSAILQRLEKDDSATVKGQAIAALGQLRASDSASVQALKSASHDPDPFVRQEVLHAFSNLPKEAASKVIPEVQTMAHNPHEDPAIRSYATQVIHQRGWSTGSNPWNQEEPFVQPPPPIDHPH